jgi:N,N'-diacetylchitobiose transport system substrate-binding protein
LKIAKFAALGVALAISLTACGGGGEEESTDATSQAPKPASITVWRFGTSDAKHETFMNEVNAAFEQQQGVKVKVEWIAWPDVTKRLTAAAAGGQGPDVTEIGNTQVVTWAAQDALADLTGKVAGWDEGKAIPQNLWVNETIDGKKYAVPWLGGVRAVIYRKDWFQELNLQVPKTWEELLAAAKTIAAKKNVAGFEINGGSDAMHALAPFIWGNGGEVVASENGKWVSKLNTPQAKEAIQWYADLVAKEKVSPAAAVTRNSIDISRQFTNGKVGMFVDGAWAKTVLTEKKKLKDDQIGAFTLPAKAGEPAPQFAGGNDLAIWKDSKATDTAWEYIKLLASKQNQAKYAPTAGLLPVYPDLLAGDTYTKDEWLGPFAKAMPLGKAYAVHENWIKVEETVVQNMLRDVVTGKKTVEEAANEAAEQMDDTLNS